MTQKELEAFSRENHKRAWMKFYPEGNGTPLNGHCLHHKDPTLKHRDPVRYAEWRPEDLVMMTKSEHTKLHMTELFTEERRQNMSKPRSEEAKANIKAAHNTHEYIQNQREAQRKRFEDPAEHEKISGEKNGMFGKKWDDAHLQYFSEINKGERNPFFGKTFTEEQLLKISNGLKNSEKYKQAMASRRGKKTGKRWFTNGIDENIYAAECPVGYRPGRIMFGYTAWNKGMKKNVV